MHCWYGLFWQLTGTDLRWRKNKGVKKEGRRKERGKYQGGEKGWWLGEEEKNGWAAMGDRNEFPRVWPDKFFFK